jgi:ketosteroid isomerase-like protein
VRAKTELETLTGIYQRWAEGDFRAGQELLADDVVFVADDPVFGQGTYHGPAEVTRYMREFTSAWRRVRHVAQEFVDYGDRVLVAARQIAVGKESGAEVDDDVFAVWTFRDGNVVRLEHFRDRAAAVAAAESR